MKNSILVGALLVSSLSFGQKKNETSAAVEFKNKYAPAMQSGDMEIAKKTILSAKEYIDLAAAHPDTKASTKTLYYKGAIYAAIVDLADLKKDSELAALVNDAFLQEAVQSIRGAAEDRKWSEDANVVSYNARVTCSRLGTAFHDNEKFAEAAKQYEWQSTFATAVGVIDSAAIYYGAVCSEKAGDFKTAAVGYSELAKIGYKGATAYTYASSAFRKAGDIASAKKIINEGQAKYPSDKELLSELVNLNIDDGNPAAAEAALNAVIAADPDNKQLHYLIGTIYIDLKENEKAEKSLNKALEIDPNYIDAQYQLGAHLYSWGTDLKNEAYSLKLGDAMYDVKLAQSDEIYKRAVTPLENYIGKNPNDAPVLKTLSQLYKSLGNTEKFQEYKKRAEEAK